jgi:hypothetical protein
MRVKELMMSFCHLCSDRTQNNAPDARGSGYEARGGVKLTHGRLGEPEWEQVASIVYTQYSVAVCLEAQSYFRQIQNRFVSRKSVRYTEGGESTGAGIGI